jgi:thiamine biosynthesis lipoprotein
MAVITQSHLAMGTKFEAILVGDDTEHLEAVAALCWEEVDRVERLLSRFDPASEVHRLNAQAVQQPVKLSVELADVIEDCFHWWQQTQGYFDITILSLQHDCGATWDAVEFDPERRLLQFHHTALRLDFGGYGKGYALDRVAQLLTKYDVANAFLHGGTSSVLARGGDDAGRPWQVDLSCGAVAVLEDTSLSTSEFPFGENLYGNWCVNDHDDEINPQERACSVIATSGRKAEALSTAIVRMSREHAQALCDEYLAQHADVRIAWSELDAVRGEAAWLQPTLQRTT